MIDFDDVASLVKMYYRAVIVILVMLALALVFWFCRGYGGREEVKTKIDEIKTTTEVHERRVDDIIESVKGKEEEAHDEIKKGIDAVSDDGLPDILAGLLREYRENR